MKIARGERKSYSYSIIIRSLSVFVKILVKEAATEGMDRKKGHTHEIHG